MCGRYVLALRPSQVRRRLEDDGMPVAEAPDDEGPNAPRRSFNFAPGYRGVVYRARSSDGHKSDYKLQTMQWGLVPSWTRRNPDYVSMLKTINCRDDSLAARGGMWASIKTRKRCLVIAEGFFEWLKVGPRDRRPHFVRRSDGHLLCLAGLWDCVHYTIITTNSNQQLRFLHDRMPVILDPDSAAIRTWLDPADVQWNDRLQSVLRPFDGRLDVYPVAKEVGKVGNDSPSFVVPLDSRHNKANIANFFSPASGATSSPSKINGDDVDGVGNHGDAPNSHQIPRVTSSPPQSMDSVKRKSSQHEASADRPVKRSATANSSSPIKVKPSSGTRKITSFFGSALPPK